MRPIALPLFLAVLASGLSVATVRGAASAEPSVEGSLFRIDEPGGLGPAAVSGTNCIADGSWRATSRTITVLRYTSSQVTPDQQMLVQMGTGGIPINFVGGKFLSISAATLPLVAPAGKRALIVQSPDWCPGTLPAALASGAYPIEWEYDQWPTVVNGPYTTIEHGTGCADISRSDSLLSVLIALGTCDLTTTTPPPLSASSDMKEAYRLGKISVCPGSDARPVKPGDSSAGRSCNRDWSSSTFASGKEVVCDVRVSGGLGHTIGMRLRRGSTTITSWQGNPLGGNTFWWIHHIAQAAAATKPAAIPRGSYSCAVTIDGKLAGARRFTVGR